MSSVSADRRRYELSRLALADGGETTVYVVVHPRRATRVRVICFQQPQRLDHWCAANGRPEAIVAGFFLRDPWRPLGEVRIDGRSVRTGRSPPRSGRRAAAFTPIRTAP
jgi:hypothetical protein